MAKEVIRKYLGEYKDKYSLNDLKKKLINSGYDSGEVEKVAKELEVNKRSRSLGDHSNKERFKKTSGKGMFIAGVIGFIFLFSYIIEIVFSLIGFEIPSSDVMNIIMIILGVVFFILFLIFYYGFFKMGKITNSKMLKYSSLGLIIVFILSIVFIVSASFIINSMVEPSFGSSANSVLSSSSQSLWMLMLPTNASSFSFFSGVGLILTMFLIVLLLAYIVFMYLFYIGLIRVGRKVIHAKITGWLGLILTIIMTLIFIGLLSMMGNLLLLSQLLFNQTLWTIFLVVEVILGVLSFFVLLLQSLTLIKASNRYER